MNDPTRRIAPLTGAPSACVEFAAGCVAWPGAVSRALCARTIAAMEAAGARSGTVLRRGAEEHDPAMRACTEHPLAPADAAAVAQVLHTAGTALLAATGGAAVALDGPLFCRYARGGHFRAHRDRSSDRADSAVVRGRRISLVCLLNDADSTPAFDGGALVLYPGQRPVNAPLAAGTVVAFPADLLHEVRPVRLGTRYAAVAWLFDVPTQGAA
jgi:predicted 2-oxoglutarate/Fe(II)-dependent dioxygenase YbiX